MPELPEAETILNHVLEKFRGKVIETARKGEFPKMWKTADDPSRLTGMTLLNGSRTGKSITFMFGLDAVQYHLTTRLGMSGTWGIFPLKTDLSHVHLSIVFKKTKMGLFYRDPRRFGSLELWNEKSKLLSGLGPDFLSVDSGAELGKRILSGRPIRDVLMDQKVVSGIGNIYVSEILFSAGIFPLRPAKTLSDTEMENVVRCGHVILRKAISMGGSTISSYSSGTGQPGKYQTLHKVYGRDGKPCLSCKDIIVRMSRGGRSLYYCPSCQK